MIQESHATSAVPVVFVVDDDISMREGLEMLIRSVGWRTAVFASAQEFLDCNRTATPSCLVLDVSLPGLTGLDLQQQLGAHQDTTPIVFITGYGDVPMTVQAMRAGATEVLTKPFADEVLLAAVRNAIRRSEEALNYQAGIAALRSRYDSLTRREKQVLALVVAGQLNKQIGGELGVREVTVKAHRGHLMRKMKAKSLAELVQMAGRLQLSMLP
jgi:FixJ family two-component response regulator